MFGSTEETTTGIIRLRALEDQGKLLLPVIAVNDAQTKHFFDNRYGTGQSTIDGILRATNVLLAGKNVVVAGYGWCGKGVSMRAKGMGANVVVTEINPVRALEAKMDGFSVAKMKDVCVKADIIITVTGNRDVVSKDFFKRIKDGCIIVNAGHFDVEIDVASLKKMSKRSWQSREHVQSYELSNGHVINLIAEGRLANLAAAEGHPSAVMDMSFAGQALSAEYLVKHGTSLERQVYSLPEDLDNEIAKTKLGYLGVEYDRLSKKQKKYLSSWGEGT
jgi:adenosylhomocysteinase